ncbi:hypothetical protein [Streptomyces kebangsaanensis]|uniref:Uncharacterized protein n=1 Tax=Streptomyces kebangsaanensis TaxID=864058 RepID=A0ABW6KNG9_9ACTN|nr:hypothetical protein [Streptomyces kebangsaanensis]
MSNDHDAFDIGLRFALQVTGTELADEPPPGTPLARVRAYAAEHGEEAVTVDVIAAAQEGRL